MKEAIIVNDSEWDKKKIAIGIVFFIIFLVAGFYAKKYFLDSNTTIVKRDSSGVVGLVEGAKTDIVAEEKKDEESTVNSVSTISTESIKEGVAEKLNSIKEQVNNLNVVDIAQSTPQYQKAIKDLQSLQELPKDEAKKACLNICSGL